MEREFIPKVFLPALLMSTLFSTKLLYQRAYVHDFKEIDMKIMSQPD